MLNFSLASLIVSSIGAFASIVGLSGLFIQVYQLRRRTEPWRIASRLYYKKWQDKVVKRDWRFGRAEIFVPKLEISAFQLQPRMLFQKCQKGEEHPIWVAFCDAIGRKPETTECIPAQRQREGLPLMGINGRNVLMLLAIIGCEGPTSSPDVIPTFDTWLSPYGEIHVEVREGIVAISFSQNDFNSPQSKPLIDFSDRQWIYSQACGVFRADNEERFYIENLQDCQEKTGVIDCRGDINFTELAREWTHLGEHRPQKILQLLRGQNIDDSRDIKSFAAPYSSDHGAIYSSFKVSEETIKILRQIISNLNIEARPFVTNEVARILLAGTCLREMEKIEEKFEEKKFLSEKVYLKTIKEDHEKIARDYSEKQDPNDYVLLNNRIYEMFKQRDYSNNSIIDQVTLESYSILSLKLIWIRNGWTTRIPARLKKYPRTVWIDGALMISYTDSTSSQHLEFQYSA